MQSGPQPSAPTSALHSPAGAGQMEAGTRLTVTFIRPRTPLWAGSETARLGIGPRSAAAHAYEHGIPPVHIYLSVDLLYLSIYLFLSLSALFSILQHCPLCHSYSVQYKDTRHTEYKCTHLHLLVYKSAFYFT